jgi:hypothetical protein
VRLFIVGALAHPAEGAANGACNLDDLLFLIVVGFLLLPTRIFQEANPLWRAASYLLAGEAILISLTLIYTYGGRTFLRHLAFPIVFFSWQFCGRHPSRSS